MINKRNKQNTVIQSGIKRVVSTITLAKLPSAHKHLLICGVIGALLGAVFFIITFGHRVIDPTYVAWIMADTRDLPQHYIGWEFFRNSAWAWPLGMAEGLAYPRGLPITYMDAIPLIAIPLKVISSFLSDQFQYFGLWGLFSYILQGGFAGLIFAYFTKRKIIVALASLFLILSPILADRMFYHTALASQWIILLAIVLLIYRHHFSKLWKFIFVWAVVFTLAVLIHPYFVPITGVFFAITVILKHETWVSSAIKSILPPLVGLGVFWIVGGFYVEDTTTDGLGVYSTNLNALVNPMGWSSILSNLPNNGKISSEGLAYLGLGTLCSIIIASSLVIFSLKYDSLRDIDQPAQIRIVLIAVLLLTVIIFALSPRIYIGDYLLFSYTPSDSIENIMSTFRATARLFWPIYYILIITSLALIIKKLDKRKFLSPLVISILLAMQLIDFIPSDEYQRIHKQYTENVAFDNKFENVAFSKITTGKEHFVYLDGGFSKIDFFHLAQYAAKRDMTINNGYLARPPVQSIARHVNVIKNELARNEVREDTVYIAANQEALKSTIESISKSRNIYCQSNLCFMTVK